MGLEISSLSVDVSLLMSLKALVKTVQFLNKEGRGVFCGFSILL